MKCVFLQCEKRNKMRYRRMAILCLYVYWLLIFILEKPLFMLCHWAKYSGYELSDWGQVMSHGLPLDLSMAGYLTALPALMILIHIWVRRRVVRVLMGLFIIISSLLIVLTGISNIILYHYWGFPLDSTPLFYFFSSPKDAFASVSVGYVVCCTMAVVLLTLLIAWGAAMCLRCPKRSIVSLYSIRQRVVNSLLLLPIFGLLFLAIRGGVTVSSMNTGKVYFSSHEPLNHAAVNPTFSIMESLAHESDFASQYRFMDDAQATRLFAELTYTRCDSTEMLLNTRRPDIYLIILESFSSRLMTSLGGEPHVAVHLDSIANDGILFTRFYANSFRTDRGLVSILSGFPAQPTMSLMKYPRKTAHLPSIAGSLKKAGYDLKYYYGGDADFTNMRSYLISQGFEQIVSDVDFPLSERLSKWGVHDEHVVERLWSDLNTDTCSRPLFRVLQTSSSHEPFEVPYQRLSDERLNAFAYTDSCVGRFVDYLKASPLWKNALVILVPDHLGAYPRNISNLVTERYEIPLIMTGGAILGSRRIDVIGSQHDIAATLLAQLGIDHSAFTFSKDLMNPHAPHFAFFTVPDAFGMVTEENELIYDNKSGKTVVDRGSQRSVNLLKGQAYLQKLYDDIDSR